MKVKVKAGETYFIFGKLQTSADGWFELGKNPFSERYMEKESKDDEKPKRGRPAAEESKA